MESLATDVDFRNPESAVNAASARQTFARSLQALFWVALMLGASGAAYRIAPDNFERYVWAAIDLTLVGAYLTRSDLIALAMRNKLLLSWSALAIVSSLWSLSPTVSVYHGLQLFMTVSFGLLFALRFNRVTALKLLYVALLLAAVLALVLNLAMPLQTTGWQGAWMGGFSHKNTLGGAMALLLVTAVCLWLSGHWRVVTGAGIILAGLLLMLSRSGTALLAVVVSLSPLPMVAALRQGRGAFAAVAGILSFAAAGGAAYFGFLDIDPVSTTLAFLGKDDTLTGRTVLWDLGTQAFQSRPLLGHGFKGYWEGELAGVQNLRFLIGSDVSIFHNNFMEVAVAFGLIGPIMLVAGLLQALGRSVAIFATSLSYTAAWPLSFTLLCVCMCISENPLFHNHSFLQFLLAFAIARTDPQPCDMDRRSRG